ncbi:MAG: class IV adenylate cyclase [Planctomycetota bacterium]
MLIEVEAKLKLADPDALVGQLEELDAVLDRRFVETSTYYDRDAGDLKTSDQGLRVRVEVDDADGATHAVMTHKGPRAHGRLKSRAETEVGVADARGAAQLLSALGYHPVLSFEKHRSRYLLDGCRVEIDRLPHLGHYVEIEGGTEDDVEAVRRKLGFGDAPLIRASYIAMLTTFLREHQLSPTHVPLDARVSGAEVSQGA